jgi:ubiquinone/menaquinone biosynthesis C-methylase UbiE
LDIGTGTGVVACSLARHGCLVKGIDHSPEMLEHARAQVNQMGLSDRVVLELGDGEKLSFPDHSFDAVTIQGVLHHLPDVFAMLKEASRVLVPGGQLYISEPCKEGALISSLVVAILSPIRLLKRTLGIRPRIEPSVSDHEEPIEGAKLVQYVKSLGFEVDAEYLVNLGFVKALPTTRLKIWATLLFSSPTRRRRGDVIFLIARKPGSPIVLTHAS